MTGTCLHGHPWTPETTITRRGHRGVMQRECRTCRVERLRAEREARWQARHAGHDITLDAAGRRRCTTCALHQPDPADVTELRHRGLPRAAIADALGCSERTVQRVLTRLNRADRSPDMPSAPDSPAPADRWRDHAACRAEDPERFFPDPTDAIGIAYAKSICGGCRVTQECAAWAFANRVDHGIWGGLAESQRRTIRKHGAPNRHADAGRSP